MSRKIIYRKDKRFLIRTLLERGEICLSYKPEIKLNLELFEKWGSDYTLAKINRRLEVKEIYSLICDLLIKRGYILKNANKD